ncbi:MAG: transcriptional coactivator p15/PC4 family protein [bacterium]
MSENQILATISKGNTEELRVAISEFKGKKYLDLRIFFTTDNGANWSPTKKGVTVAPDSIEVFLNAVEKAKELLSE